MTAVRVVPAGAADIPAIAALESRPENMPFVRDHTAAEHRAIMSDPDARYLRIEDAAGKFLGFALLTGLGAVADGIRLLRIAVEAPGRGVGRAAMAAITALVFGELGARRFWLDVFEDNARACRLYRGLGFRDTGFSHPPSRPRRDGGAAPLIRMELRAEDFRAEAIRSDM